MNKTQIIITSVSVFVVSAASALLFNLLNKPRNALYSEEYESGLDRPRRFPTDEYIYNLNPSYKPKYDADMDPTMQEYDPFRRTEYKGGTRCMNCHTRLRYTRRK